jgi:glyoxylase-like metal-dependent hydrolase (beta-lactamase superfamily II)
MFVWKTNLNTKIILFKIGITNCYFIEIQSKFILVDTGQKRYSNKLNSSLESKLDTKKKLDYLILSHTHYDHSQNARMVQQRFSPKVLVHKKECDSLENGFTTLPKGTNTITNFISAMGNKFASWIGEYEPLVADIKFDESVVLEDIDGLRIIETPGHTAGSISIIIDDEIAIVGDTLFRVFTNKIMPPFADDKNELIESWKKLLQTNCKLFLPAHGKAIQRELLEKELRKLIT